jgi:NAD(P)-dependent dehydrogenase (short-subunit alcohol dehydrogenase family)
MDLELNGKHVLITGGSKGIGLACARAFLQEGARVSLIARRAETLNDARASLLASFPGAAVNVIAADLKDASAAVAALDAAEAALGPIDALVNSAGAARRAPPDELTPQHWRDGMDAKYFTYVNVVDPAIKRMAERGAGAIVNVVGMGGKVASPIHLAGGAANAALMLMSVGLAAAYGRRGVRVNAVNPGLTLTERMDEGLAADARMSGTSKEDALAKAGRLMPLGRPARPEEIANAVVFLCSPRASYISGAVLSMDGALTPVVV